MFCQVVRDQVKAEYPDLGRTEMTRALAEKWKNLPEEEKQVISLSLFSNNLPL